MSPAAFDLSTMTPHAWPISAPGWALDGRRRPFALLIAPNPVATGRQHPPVVADTPRIVYSDQHHSLASLSPCPTSLT